MSVRFQPAVGVASASGVAGKPQAPSLGETLGRFLRNTLNGAVAWKETRGREGENLVETFTAEDDRAHIEMKAVRQASHSAIPAALKRWSVTVTRKLPGGRKATGKGQVKVLDGESLFLPEHVSETGDLADRVLPKLFRAVYEQVRRGCNHLVGVIGDLTEQLRQGLAQATRSVIKPSVRYGGVMSGALVMQVGSGENGSASVEYVRFGGNSLFTIRHQGRSTKLQESQLSPELHSALDALVQEANFIHTRKRQGLQPA